MSNVLEVCDVLIGVLLVVMWVQVYYCVSVAMRWVECVKCAGGV